MAAHSFPRAFQHPSDRALTGKVPPHFEAFYRAQLRFRTGGRMRSMEVFDRYRAWAAQVGAASMSLKEICGAMAHIGHRRLRSNQTYFGDVQLAAADPALPDNFPAGDAANVQGNAVLSMIDRIEADLRQLRRAVAARPAGQGRKGGGSKL